MRRDIGRVLAASHPDELTTEFRKANRGERILVDTARNAYAQTTVPPYAVRPRPGAPVATPIDWDELSDSKLRPDRWTVKNVLRRLQREGRSLGRHLVVRARDLQSAPPHRLAPQLTLLPTP